MHGFSRISHGCTDGATDGATDARMGIMAWGGGVFRFGDKDIGTSCVRGRWWVWFRWLGGWGGAIFPWAGGWGCWV